VVEESEQLSGKAKPAVGFDFGTTTTLIANQNGPLPIGPDVQASWMPSVVGYSDDGSPVVGEAARSLPPNQIVRSIKRSITDDRTFVRMDTPTGIRDVRTDDLMVAILREAAKRAEAKGQNMSDGQAIRIGCPAMWNGKQRRRLEAVARQAGLPISLENFVDEPVAAGIAWIAGHEVDATTPLRVLVFDMGGGTLDIAVLDVRGAKHYDISVLAAIGAAEAGDALDDAIAADLEFELAMAGFDINATPNPRQAKDRLRSAARDAKINLTYQAQTDVELSKRVHGIATIPYSRDQLNEVFAPQMDRAELYVAAALRAARLAEPAAGSVHELLRTPTSKLAETVDVVVLSGGMSQIPYVSQRLKELVPAATRIEMATQPSENAVAIGLAHASRFGRISVYRPAFDILLEWDHGQEFRVVYDAFTPLIQPGQIAQGTSDLRYVVNGLDLMLPRKGTGRLRVVSQSGQRVHATIGGADLDGFQVVLSEQDFEFSIYPGGRIRMTDGAGSHDGHVSAWHFTDTVL
jgi:molecular chaperone DnaK (HSP70)